MSTITILGSGLMGTAVAWPLADNGHEVRLVGTHLDAEIIRSCLNSGYHPRLRRQLPGRVTSFYVEDLPKALDGADLIVSGVNSLGVHWIGRTFGPAALAGRDGDRGHQRAGGFAGGQPTHPARCAAGRAAARSSGPGDTCGHRRAVHRRRAGRTAALVRRVHVRGMPRRLNACGRPLPRIITTSGPRPISSAWKSARR